MNHKQRRKVSKTLRTYRSKTKLTPTEIAGRLNWPVALYLEVEAGKAGLSEGQVSDVRRLLQREIKAATVRDRIRNPRGGIRILRHQGQVGALAEGYAKRPGEEPS